MKRWLIYALMGIFALLFAVSGYFIFSYHRQTTENREFYGDMSAMVEQIRATIPTEETLPQPEVPTAPTEPSVLPEYAPILELNSHLVGWIKIDGTRIDYPVLQTPETPNFYINHNFEGKSSKYGAIYVQENCDVFAPSDNVIVYGHRMNDGEMFADLLKYKDQSFYENHKYITFDTLYDRQTYEIVAVFQIKSVENNTFAYNQFVDFQAQSQFDTFMTRVDLLELYHTGVEVQYGDRLLTLSTCEKSYKNGRFVVVAKKIDH